MQYAAKIKLPEELRVVSEREAAAYCNLSLVHFRRLRHHRQGPKYVQLTERRVGYRFKDLTDWIEQRIC